MVTCLQNQRDGIDFSQFNLLSWTYNKYRLTHALIKKLCLEYYFCQKLYAATSISSTLIEDWGQKYVAILEWSGPKSIEVVDNSGNCQFFLNIKQVSQARSSPLHSCI